MHTRFCRAICWATESRDNIVAGTSILKTMRRHLLHRCLLVLTSWYARLGRICCAFVSLWPALCMQSCSTSVVVALTTQGLLSASDIAPASAKECWPLISISQLINTNTKLRMLPPGESRWVCSACPIKVSIKTDGRIDGRQTETLRLHVCKSDACFNLLAAVAVTVVISRQYIQGRIVIGKVGSVYRVPRDHEPR